jgi:hypothetical protein
MDIVDVLENFSEFSSSNVRRGKGEEVLAR